MRLSRSRQYAMDGQPLPIPFEAIDRYAARFGPHGTDAFDDWLSLIETMDQAWLELSR